MSDGPSPCGPFCDSLPGSPRDGSHHVGEEVFIGGPHGLPLRQLLGVLACGRKSNLRSMSVVIASIFRGNSR